MKNSTVPVAVRSHRAGAVLVCKKCLKRLDEGKGLKRALKAELKGRAGNNGKRPRMILTDCFGLCPKRAVVTASANTLCRGEFLLMSEHSSISDSADILLRDQR